MRVNSSTMANIKVLYISANGYLGGAEAVVLKMAEAHKPPFQASILFLNNGEAVELAKQKNIKVILLTKAFKLSHPFKLFKALLEIRSLIVSGKYDVLHSTMAYAHLVVGLATTGMKVKRVWFQHGPVGKWLDHLANNFKAHLIFFNSDYLQKIHNESTASQSHSKEIVIPLGITCPLVISSNEKQQGLSIGMAGRITSGKAYEKIIFALIELRKQGTDLSSIRCLIAGSPKKEKDFQYQKYLLSLIEQNELQTNVKFIGHVEEMSKFYNQIDVFVHATSEPEPFGLVVAEAMANNVVTIASNSGGTASLISNNVTGFLYYSSQELTNCLKTVLSLSVKDREQIARAGKDFIEANYSVERMISTIEDAYLGILSDDC